MTATPDDRSVDVPLATQSDEGGALRRIYLGAIDVAPDRWEPSIRSSATTLRIARRAVRRIRRRAVRRAWYVARTNSFIRPSYRYVLAASAWIRTRVPATIPLGGDGPIVMVDARGRTNAEVVEALASSPAPIRAVVLVDDPDLDLLRRAGLVYEFLPPPGVAGVDGAEQQRLLDERRPSFEYLYRAYELVPLDDVAAPPTGQRPVHGAAAR